jgi:hypothetical protein
MSPAFTQLNHGWTAEPNAPDPQAEWEGTSLRLRFRMNPFQFPEYAEDDIGEIVFEDCSRFRVGSVNDEGWFCGQGRLDRAGHIWSGFYEVTGGLDPDADPDDWVVRCQDTCRLRHFLFYFRDEDFECIARSWNLKTTKAIRTWPSQPLTAVQLRSFP